MKKWMQALFLGCLGLIFAAGCVPAGVGREEPSRIPDTPTPDAQDLFAYDAAVPFDAAIRSETERDGVTIVDLSYAAHDPAFSSSTGGRTIAYLVKPSGEGPYPGVIYVHWLGNSNSNRSQFLEEAVEMAGRGFVCLLPQGYFPWMTLPMGEQDRSKIIGQTVEFRRAIDFLAAQPEVDPARIGFVGHDFGAMYGGILSGVEDRLKTYILITGTPSFADWIVYFQFPRSVYDSIAAELDPVLYLPHAAPASLFFQYAENDAFVPREKALAFSAAGSEPKRTEWYEDIHDMSGSPSRLARESWLIEELK